MVSTKVVEVKEASRGLRNHVKEPEPKTNAEPQLALAATVYEPTSGRVMQVYTSEPGLQFYTGNFLDGTLKGKKGIVYNQRAGFVMETQHFPDSPNHDTFPSTILHPGSQYHSRSIYKFSVRAR